MQERHARTPRGETSRDVLRELGVQPIINAAGTYTKFGGMMPRPEVARAMVEASGAYARLEDVHAAVGARIAALLECEAALVTSGATGALVLGTAACITGEDPARVQRLPDVTGLKSEVVIQRAHHFTYKQAVRTCGVRLIEVDTADELERAISPRTAMLLFLNKADPAGQIRAADFIEIARRHGVPTLNDAAGDVPPVDRLFRLTRMGFDLVVFSGGKGLGGPQSAGLLLGRRDLISAARLNTSPHSETVGRGLKVSKEEVVGMLVALELFLARDHEAEWKQWEAFADVVCAGVGGLPDIEAERFTPIIANQVPHIRIRWRGEAPGTMLEVAQELRDGDPAIEVVPVPSESESLEIAMWTLRPGEPEVVARRLREIFDRRMAGVRR